MPTTLLIAGATGLIGDTTLNLALADPRVGRVLAPVRKALPVHPKLEQLVHADILKALPSTSVDAVICCLGTTIKNVGGDRKKFIHVDKDLVVGLAEWSVAQQVPMVCIVSAMGADASSSVFYNRVKGEMENAVKALPISGLHIFRPSLLTGPRSEKRLGERIGIVAMSMVAPLMVGPMRPYRPMPHDTLAKALLRTALKGSAGIHTHTYDGIRALADQNITDGSSR